MAAYDVQLFQQRVSNAQHNNIYTSITAKCDSCWLLSVCLEFLNGGICLGWNSAAARCYCRRKEHTHEKKRNVKIRIKQTGVNSDGKWLCCWRTDWLTLIQFFSNIYCYKSKRARRNEKEKGALKTFISNRPPASPPLWALGGGRTTAHSQQKWANEVEKVVFVASNGGSFYKFVIIYWLRCAMFLSLWEWVKCWAASGKFVCVIVDITFLSNYIRFF